MTIAARSYFVDLLHETNGNVTQMSKIADVHRTFIYNLLKRLGLDLKKYQPEPRYKVMQEFRDSGFIQWLGRGK